MARLLREVTKSRLVILALLPFHLNTLLPNEAMAFFLGICFAFPMVLHRVLVPTVMDQVNLILARLGLV